MNGSSSPTWESIAIIAKTLGVTSDYLVGVVDYKTMETRGTTLSDVGFSEKATINLVDENGWSHDAIKGLNMVLETDSFAEVFQLIPTIASLASTVIDEIENDSIDNDPSSYSNQFSSYRKNELVMSLDVFNYLSFQVDEVGRKFRDMVAMQTQAERPAALYKQYLKRMHDNNSKNKDATSLDSVEDDIDGIDEKENN
jgi:hypothetical protein